MAILMVIEPASAFGQNGNGLFQRRSNLQGSPSFDLDRYRLRIIWGGGQADVWQGNLVLEDGTFENVRVLGLEPDAGAGIEVSSNEVQIRTSRKSNYSGFDIDIVGDRNQKLMLDLQSVTPDGRLSGLQSQQIDLGSLLNSFDSNINSIQIPLDDTGNRIDINRAPGDRIPISTTRSHLVFDPGESFELSIEPFRGIPDAGDNAKLQLEILESGQERSASLFTEQYALLWDGNLYTKPDAIRLNLPDREGVFNIRLTFRDESMTGRFGLNRQSLTRDIQVVVVQRQKARPDDRIASAEQVTLWSEVFNSEDVRNQWIDRIPGVPKFRLASSREDSQSLRNGGVAPQIIEGKTWNSFAAGGWQAVPLEVTELNKPHIVEIEYLDDGPMAMGISVLQPTINGQIDPFGVDSGISIPSRPGATDSETGTIRRHRIFFWPNHKTPYLLFANRHANRVARIGAIRILAGPDRLAAPVESEEQGDIATQRKYMAFYEKPLFVENFSGTMVSDPQSGESWHDWNSFLTGANRWTQYLKANGYNSAMLIVAGDGSSYYPSQLLQPNSRFDSGVMSPQGSDPIRKDVVELLLRVFEREGLQLVPVFHFNSPLRELETQRLTGSPEAEGILLLDAQGNSRLPDLESQSNPVSIYNPLDPRVQQAHLDVVQEFLERYRGRDSFKRLGGVGFLYSKDALQVIPGQAWGVDRTTLRRFLQDTGTNIESDSDWLAQLLDGQGRVNWLAWRQSQTANWLDELQRSGPPAERIYLLGSDMFETQDAFSALAPSLRRSSDMNEAMSRIGFPHKRVAKDANMVFLQPSELAPEQSLSDNRLNIQLNQTADGSRVFNEFANSGKLFSHRYSWAEFEQLRQKKLFGQPQQQPLMRLQPLSPAGIWNRERLARSIADSDSQTLVEGGWLTGFGQEEHVAGLVEIFTRLPDVRFTDVNATDSSQPKTGVVVRQASVGDRNWFYVVNPTPWKLAARIQLSSHDTLIQSIGMEIAFDGTSEMPTMTVELEPFSLQAAYLDGKVNVVDYQVDLPDEATNELQNRLNNLLTRVSRAAQVEPIDVLSNPGFEDVTQSGDGPRRFGWSFDNRATDVITLKQDGVSEGSRALTMVSRGTPTWIRSNEFAAPVTGRLSISVMVRTDDPTVQPPLRISVQGDDHTQVYYRYGVVGGETRQINNEWQEFAVHFDDLPLQDSGALQVGFDLMGIGQVDIDQVRVFDRWLDAQDSRSLTQLLALAGFQLTNKQNIDRCRRILNGYWPQFLEEFFPDEQPDALTAEDPQPGTRSSRLTNPESNRQ